MIIAISFLVSSWITGLVLTLSTCYPILSMWTCYFASLPISFNISAALCYVLSLVYGRLHEDVLIGCCVIQLVGAAAILMTQLDTLRIRRRLITGELSLRWNWRVVGIYVLSTLLFLRFCYFQHLHVLTTGPYAGLFSGGATWGDMGIHLDIMNSFINGQNTKLSFSRWPQSPIYANAALVYPFLPDFHSAALVCGGFSERLALLVPSTVLGGALFALLATFGYKFCGDRWACGVSAVWLFVCCGGVGWWYYTREAGIPFVHELKYDYVESYGGPYGMYWFATMPHVLLPQRTALFGYPIVVMLLLALVEFAKGVHTTSLPNLTRCLLFVAFNIGLLPLNHTHSLYCCFVILAVFVLARPTELLQPRIVALWVFFALLTALVAAPQLPLFFARVTSARFVEVKGMWLDDDWVQGVMNPLMKEWVGHGTMLASVAWYAVVPLVFFMRATSLYLPLAMVCVFMYEAPWQRRISLTGWALFALGITVRMQPWKKDNIKILYVWLMIAVCEISLLFKRGFSRRGVAAVAVACAFLAMTGSGSLTLSREFVHYHQYLSDADVDMGRFCRQNLNGSKVIIASDKHNHPVANLAGMTTMSGFGGWLHSHGYEHLHVRFQLQGRILNGVPGCLRVVKDFDIGYAIIDWHLKRQHDIDFDFLDQHADLLYDKGDNKVYAFHITK
eukprot:TRINITY_DN5707_c0_g1_i1.p1 TRINITY_DN5707_c0_g1~~TRINITY_DN5707_c0_g1_i1.p1  ORF type:complete len:704 (+),score=267.61 TRINITY_DN5707_c0_g1_i1:89-2113(+)